jgi:hypothetical protein
MWTYLAAVVVFVLAFNLMAMLVVGAAGSRRRADRSTAPRRRALG